MGTLKIYDGSEYKPAGVTIEQTIYQYNVEEMVKLWENPNPTSEFAAQTINVPWSEYEIVRIISPTDTADIVCKKGNGGQLRAFKWGTNSLNAAYRSIILEDDGVRFPVGTAVPGYATSNSDCVPLVIYGIKKASKQTSGGVSLEKVYPVGAVYLSTVSTSPAELFGFGTWQQVKDRFLLAAGDTYAAGSTGGEATHTLTANEMPSHNHPIMLANTPSAAGVYGVAYQNTSGATFDREWAAGEMVGGSQPHNNMPPYLTVYMWIRTA